MNQKGSGDPTPEQLMQSLDAELALRRSHSTHRSRNRAIFLVAGILFIVIAAGAALLVLDQMLAEYRSGEHHVPPPARESRGNF